MRMRGCSTLTKWLSSTWSSSLDGNDTRQTALDIFPLLRDLNRSRTQAQRRDGRDAANAPSDGLADAHTIEHDASDEFADVGPAQSAWTTREWLAGRERRRGRRRPRQRPGCEDGRERNGRGYSADGGRGGDGDEGSSGDAQPSWRRRGITLDFCRYDRALLGHGLIGKRVELDEGWRSPWTNGRRTTASAWDSSRMVLVVKRLWPLSIWVEALEMVGVDVGVVGVYAGGVVVLDADSGRVGCGCPCGRGVVRGRERWQRSHVCRCGHCRNGAASFAL